jgi:hypothetical protein
MRQGHCGVNLKQEEVRMRRRTVLSTSLSAGFLALVLLRATPAVAAGSHPEIRKAIHALELARNHLQHAAHDFGGHRVEALQSIDNALTQLRIALKYDKE